MQDTTLVVGVEYGLLTGSTGQNLSATIVGQPAHGSIQLHKDGSFQYTPESGFTGNDHFKFRDSPDDPRIQTAKIDVMTPDVWAKQPAPQPTTASGQGSVGVSPMDQVSDQGESLSDSDATGQGGTPLHFTVSVAGVWPYTMVQTRVQKDTTTPLKDPGEILKPTRWARSWFTMPSHANATAAAIRPPRRPRSIRRRADCNSKPVPQTTLPARRNSIRPPSRTRSFPLTILFRPRWPAPPASPRS